MNTASLPPAVSVILPCHDAVLVLLRAQLEALAVQRNAPDFEVVICDNGVNPALPELVAGTKQSYPGVEMRIVDATAQLGTAYARNQGIAVSRGAKLLFCDADDLVGPDWVAAGAAALDRFRAFSGGAIPFTAEELEQSREVVWREMARRLPDYVPDGGHMNAGTYPILLGCSFGMTREFADQLGGFDESLGSQAEDNELAFRIQQELGRVPRAAEVAVAYRLRPRAEMRYSRAFWSGYNHAAVCARYDAWAISPSYQGHWVIRPVREGLVGLRPRELRLKSLARLAGLVVGRVRFRGSARRSG